jgi:TonB family protein
MPEPVNDHDFEPVYPPQARRDGREAVVVVELHIDPTGRVASAHALEAPRGWGFEKAAEDYARRLRFRPALAGRKPVASRIEWSVHFYVRH